MYSYIDVYEHNFEQALWLHEDKIACEYCANPINYCTCNMEDTNNVDSSTDTY